MNYGKLCNSRMQNFSWNSLELWNSWTPTIVGSSEVEDMHFYRIYLWKEWTSIFSQQPMLKRHSIGFGILTAKRWR